MAMIPYILEEDATSKKRYLEGLYVDVGMVVSPSVGTDSVGDECREQAIEVEEKEHGPELVSQSPREEAEYSQDTGDEQFHEEHPLCLLDSTKI